MKNYLGWSSMIWPTPDMALHIHSYARMSPSTLHSSVSRPMCICLATLGGPDTRHSDASE